MFHAPTSSRVQMFASFFLQQLLVHAVWAAATARTLKPRHSLLHRAFRDRWNPRATAWRATEDCKSAGLDGTDE